jgi:hypothetical protein
VCAYRSAYFKLNSSYNERTGISPAELLGNAVKLDRGLFLTPPERNASTPKPLFNLLQNSYFTGSTDSIAAIDFKLPFSAPWLLLY